MTATATPVDGGRKSADALSLPGLVAAATWAVGLVVGVTALFAGYVDLAAALLAVAVTAPLVGLASVSRGKETTAR